MANVLDLTNLTINPEEARTISEIQARLMLENPKFASMFTTFSGFTYAQKIAIANELGLTGKLDAGGARPTSGNLGGSFTEKEVKVVGIGDTLYHTQADVNQNWKMMVRKTAQDFKELNMNSDVALYITGILYQAIDEARWRMTMLGDTKADTVANGGVLVNGTDKTLFNALDGVWAQIANGVTANTIKRTTIAENSQSSFTAQLALGPTAGVDALKGMYFTSNAVLKGKSDAYFCLTPELYYNYEDWLTTHPSTGGGMSSDIINGVKVMKYKGYPVIKDELTGSVLKAYFQNGTKYSAPNRGFFTCTSNLGWYTTSESDLSNIESFYDMPNRVNIMAYLFNMAVLILREQLITVAY
jgi:hypothetical protein